MHIVLVFRRKVFGYSFECEEAELIHVLDRIKVRLEGYLSTYSIRKKYYVTKLENSGKIFKGFIGLDEEYISSFAKDLEEIEIETGKYLKFGNFSVGDNITERIGVGEKIQTYLIENNIRTDWMRFSFGRDSYLRIVN
ncbi:hypothetical protein V6Z05_05815 [Leptospira venezuelensis]|uniref:hypothetical protein n=1 Tax=Leptospira venezuelensis TaxID=1958811 RepID=UPI000A372993|nr:hypothetical protein [Leptospira venezuelensis]